MEDRAKQRLIGVLLLALLVAILAPLLLRSPEEVRVALDLAIPEEPEISAMPAEPVVDEEDRAAVVDEIRQDREQVRRESEAYHQALEAAPDDVEPQEEMVISGEPPLSGWAVQLGSFGSRDNAVGLVGELRDAGQNAFVREGEHEGEARYRVFAGPELERDAALALRDRLAGDERFALEGLVVPLDP